jgi:hypothetical protein
MQKLEFVMKFYENNLLFALFIYFWSSESKGFEILFPYLHDSVGRQNRIFHGNNSVFLLDWDILGIRSWRCVEIILYRLSYVWVHINKVSKPLQVSFMTICCVRSCTEVMCYLHFWVGFHSGMWWISQVLFA